jgi:hypothetical protein
MLQALTLLNPGLMYFIAVLRIISSYVKHPVSRKVLRFFASRAFAAGRSGRRTVGQFKGNAPIVPEDAGRALYGIPGRVITRILRNLTFIDKKKASLNPTLAPRYQYSQCDSRAPIAVDVLFAHATGACCPGPGRCAGQTLFVGQYGLMRGDGARCHRETVRCPPAGVGDSLSPAFSQSY